MLWLTIAHDIAATDPALLQAWKPEPTVDIDLSGAAQWRADRRAVPLEVYRRARFRLTAKVEGRRRRGRLHLEDHVFLAWRDLLLLCLAGETGARASELASVAPDDFRRMEFNGRMLAVVMLLPRKRSRRRRTGGRSVRRKVRPQKRPQVISEQTLALAGEWIELHELSGDPRPIWLSHKNGDGRLTASGLSRRLSGATDGTLALLPRIDGEGGYSLHSLRHAVEALCFGIGSSYLDVNRAWQERVSAQVFAAAKLMHDMPLDALGYKDYKANADRFQAIAAIGSPEQGVPGLLDIVGGDAGARLGWDLDAIRDAMRSVRSTEAHLKAAECELNARRLQREELVRRSLPKRPTQNVTELGPADDELDVADVRAAFADVRRVCELLLDRDIAREARDRERAQIDDAIEDAHKARDQAAHRHSQTRAQLDEIRQAGRTFPLPDELPTADELRLRHPNDDTKPPTPLDAESWEDALSRAHIHIDIYDDEPVTVRVRSSINMPEAAAVMGVTDGALRKRIREKRLPFTVEGADSPMIVIGDPATSKLRFFDVDKFPREFVDDLLPEQREMLEALLSVPMGTTRFGGRVLSEGPHSR